MAAPDSQAFVLRQLVDELAAQLRSGVDKLTDLPQETGERLARELGLVQREELESLELRLAQLEHRLKLLERNALNTATPAREDVLEVGAHRARDEDEEPVAGLDDGAAARWDRVVAAVITAIRRRAAGRARGRPSRRSRGRRATAKSTSSSLLSGPTSSGASCTGGAGASRPSRPATRSSVVPCTIAETTTTKKTALKIVSLSGHVRGEDERREHDRDRAAEPGPAEQRAARGR